MDLHDEIAKVAYELYEKSGRIEGRDQENWLEAERIVKARYAEKAEAPKEKIKPAKKAVAKTGTRTLVKKTKAKAQA